MLTIYEASCCQHSHGYFSATPPLTSVFAHSRAVASILFEAVGIFIILIQNGEFNDKMAALGDGANHRISRSEVKHNCNK